MEQRENTIAELEKNISMFKNDLEKLNQKSKSDEQIIKNMKSLNDENKNEMDLMENRLKM